MWPYAPLIFFKKKNKNFNNKRKKEDGGGIWPKGGGPLMHEFAQKIR